MGWGSGVYLFDQVVEVAIQFAPKIPEHASTNRWNTPDILVNAIVREMYTKVDWEDWDTQLESKFFDRYLVHIMYELGEIDDEFYEGHYSTLE